MSQFYLKQSAKLLCSPEIDENALCDVIIKSVGSGDSWCTGTRKVKLEKIDVIIEFGCFPCFVSQGLFFDEAYGFYPGQVLIGPAKVFSNVQWLSGVKPVLSRKCKFRVVVEEVTQKLKLVGVIYFFILCNL